MNRGNRARLGRGLGALLGEEAFKESPGDVRSVPVRRIVPNPFQPRREFRDEELADLKASIASNGLLQPLVVRPSPDREGAFQLVAGERRFRSVRALEWEEVPVVLRDVDDRTLLVLALVENIQRERLNPLEEAEGYRVLLEEFDLTQAEVAEAVGKNRSTVANALRLLRLPLSIRKLVEEQQLSMGHARALLSLDDPGRITEMGRRAAREGWSVRQVEARTRTSRGGDGSGASPRPTPDAMTRSLQEELRQALGTKVRLRSGKKGRGTIEIPFRDLDDFARVFEALTGRPPAPDGPG
ncbi:MAG: ParB/RepB/Spo0J family partition protein [Gemmatimonadales bacterium]|nr:MAG: ParB/RepB/Spo0J family partition protein [Gemmatimonadales bacterium]